MKFINTIALIVLLVIVLVISACKKDQLLTDSSAKLDIAVDTVFFDTVFTTVGSTTRIFTIHNKHNQPLNISKIYLPKGAMSQFRVNVDGINGTSIADVEILPKDSLFVFVQVTVNPFNSNSPMVVAEQLIFETNGNIQDVDLVAVGQDVYLHKPDKPSNKPFYSIVGCNEVWTNDKPHLIFGYAVVDSGCKLTIMPGTRVHLWVQSNLWVYDGATLEIKGAYGNEVKIEGARLEQDYKDVPGQWGRVWLSKGSKNNTIDWAIIKNGSIGIHCDSLGAANQPLLTLSNTVIKNMQTAALYTQNSHVRAVNCVFANCGLHSVFLNLGGKYRFMHCTFANYWADQRGTPLLALKNYYTYESTAYVYNLDSAYFGNCILDGNIDEELAYDSLAGAGAKFSYKFENCILKTKLNTSNTIHYVSIYKNINPGFKDYTKNDYQLNASSPAVDKGYPNPYSIDLNNKIRPNNSFPDIGAYEFY